MSVLNFLKDLKPFLLMCPMTWILWCMSMSPGASQGQYFNRSCQITITEDGVIGVYGWLPFDKSIPNFYTFDKNATMLSPK
ncbi:unnamed protein product [Lymnaea stagnalis]|uniref:Uncharacterized protein n=1 Tax=Lymnaea stagnalis TaxID=6523 RepID=A0AAV2IP51_LYMST